MIMEFLARPTESEERSGPAFWIDEAIWGIVSMTSNPLAHIP